MTFLQSSLLALNNESNAVLKFGQMFRYVPYVRWDVSLNEKMEKIVRLFREEEEEFSEQEK